MSDQDTWAGQSKFRWGAWGGPELQEALSGMYYSYVCQHVCL